MSELNDIYITKLYKIHIRNTFRNFAIYYLKIKDEVTQKIYETKPTKKCIIPQFSISYLQKDLYTYLQNPDNKLLTITLYEIKPDGTHIQNCNFKMELPESLIYMGNSISQINIKIYPSIIFEYSNGFYTIKGEDIENSNNNNIIKDISYNHINKLELLERNIVENDISELLDIRKQYEFAYDDLIKKKKLLDTVKKDVIRFYESKKDIFNMHYTKINLLSDIQILSKKIETKSIKNDNIALMVDNIKSVIKYKKDRINNMNNILEKIKSKRSISKIQIEQNNQLVFNNKCLIKKNLMEFYNIFLNQKALRSVIAPFFNNYYNILFNNQTDELVYQNYINNKNICSLSLGYMSKIILFLSKIFNIPIQFCLFENGLDTAIKYDKYSNLIKFYYNTNEVDEKKQCQYIYKFIKLLENNCEEINRYLIELNVFNKDTIEAFEENILNKNNTFVVFLSFFKYLIDMKYNS